MSDLVDKQDKTTTPFLQRWSKRKLQHAASRPDTTSKEDAETPSLKTISETELPPIDSLHEDSEVSMFLGDGISEALQRQALRKLFHMGKFNVCDGLDDYADDYTIFEKLDVVLETRKKLQDIQDKLSTDSTDQIDTRQVKTQATDHAESDSTTATNLDDDEVHSVKHDGDTEES